MTRLVDALADGAEQGLLGVASLLATVGQGLDRLSGSPPPAGGDPERPVHVDDVTSAWANDVVRALRRTWRVPSSWREAAGEVVGRTVGATAAGVGGRSAGELLALPLRLPVSWGALAAQEGLRALAAARVVPPERLADFVGFVVEIFSDLDVYFTLRYQEELERWHARLERDPDDARARLELAATYAKCGLFEQAAAELEPVARGAAGDDLRRAALYHRLVASYRAGDLATAFADGAECLRLDPGHEEARYWLFLAADRAGGYPPSVAPELRMEARDGRHPTPVRYREVAAEIGLDKVSGGRGTAVADFFGDGHLDVAVAGAHAGVSLFRNRGDGTFEDVSVGSGLEGCVYGFALAAADYDNDGRTDLFVSGLGFYDGRSYLYRNEGGGVFRDVTREAGLGGWGPAFTATWVDYDRDGRLDLFVVHNLGGLFDRKVANRLYRNNGDGTFTDVTREAGLEVADTTIGACWGDFANDGWPDLFVSGLGRARLFRNRQDGTFEDASREAGIDRPAIGSVALAMDVDDDGWLDVVQTTYSRPREAIHTLRHGRGPADGSPTRIWRNRGDGTFADVAPELGLTGCWGTMSAAAGDFENSGRQGLFLGNGDPRIDRSEASVLLAHDGERLRNVTFTAGLPPTGKGHGVNLADLAGDGRLHLIVAAGGLYPGDLASTAVYRPTAKPGHHLGVRLVGTESNRDAIGARLALEVGGRRRHRRVDGGSGFGWAPLHQHFGLGEATEIGALEVDWPSGRRERVEGLPADATVEIVEGRAAAWRVVRGAAPGDRREEEP